MSHFVVVVVVVIAVVVAVVVAVVIVVIKRFSCLIYVPFVNGIAACLLQQQKRKQQ